MLLFIINLLTLLLITFFCVSYHWEYLELFIKKIRIVLEFFMFNYGIEMTNHTIIYLHTKMHCFKSKFFFYIFKIQNTENCFIKRHRNKTRHSSEKVKHQRSMYLCKFEICSHNLFSLLDQLTSFSFIFRRKDDTIHIKIRIFYPIYII